MIDQISRRIFLGHMQVALVFLFTLMLALSTAMANSDYAEPEEASLPASDMRLDPQRVALVVIDPQNDFAR